MNCKLPGWALLIGLLGACAAPNSHIEPTGTQRLDAALAGCCAGGKNYPDWLVKTAETQADWIVPISRGTKLRSAYLEEKPEAWAEVLKGARTLDLVLIANKSRLSGAAGEGFFGHSAVYLGGKAEMKTLGLWQDPLIRPHRALFEAGNVSIEAIDGGVRLSRPKQLFEADAAALFHAKKLSFARKKRVVRWLLSQLGRPFDNRFDLEDPEALYCTELIHTALPEMALPVTQTFGRAVVWPDEVAARSLIGKTGFTFRRFVHANKDGWQVGSRNQMAAQVLAAWNAM